MKQHKNNSVLKAMLRIKKADRLTDPEVRRILKYNQPFIDNVGAKWSISLSNRDLSDIRTIYPGITGSDFKVIEEHSADIVKLLAIVNDKRKSKMPYQIYAEKPAIECVDNRLCFVYPNGDIIPLSDKELSDMFTDMETKYNDEVSNYIWGKKVKQLWEPAVIAESKQLIKDNNYPYTLADCCGSKDLEIEADLHIVDTDLANLDWNTEAGQAFLNVIKAKNRSDQMSMSASESKANFYEDTDSQLAVQDVQDYILDILCKNNGTIAKNPEHYRNLVKAITYAITWDVNNASSFMNLLEKHKNNISRSIQEQYDENGDMLGIDKKESAEAVEAYTIRNILSQAISDVDPKLMKYLTYPIDKTNLTDKEKAEADKLDEEYTEIFNNLMAQYEADYKEYVKNMEIFNQQLIGNNITVKDYFDPELKKQFANNFGANNVFMNNDNCYELYHSLYTYVANNPDCTVDDIFEFIDTNFNGKFTTNELDIIKDKCKNTKKIYNFPSTAFKMIDIAKSMMETVVKDLQSNGRKIIDKPEMPTPPISRENLNKLVDILANINNKNLPEFTDIVKIMANSLTRLDYELLESRPKTPNKVDEILSDNNAYYAETTDEINPHGIMKNKVRQVGNTNDANMEDKVGDDNEPDKTKEVTLSNGETHQVIPVHNMGAILAQCKELLYRMRTINPDASQLNPDWNLSDVPDASNSGAEWQRILQEGWEKAFSKAKASDEKFITNTEKARQTFISKLTNPNNKENFEKLLTTFADKFSKEINKWQESVIRPDSFPTGEPRQNAGNANKNKSESNRTQYGWQHIYNILGAVAWVNNEGRVVNITQATDIDKAKADVKNGKNPKTIEEGADFGEDFKQLIIQECQAKNRNIPTTKNGIEFIKAFRGSKTAPPLFDEEETAEIIDKCTKLLPFRIGVGNAEFKTNMYDENIGLKSEIKTSENFKKWEDKIQKWVDTCEKLEESIRTYATQANQKYLDENLYYDDVDKDGPHKRYNKNIDKTKMLHVSGNEPLLWGEVIANADPKYKLKYWYNTLFNFVQGSSKKYQLTDFDGNPAKSAGTTNSVKLYLMLVANDDVINELDSINDVIYNNADEICKSVFLPNEVKAHRIIKRRLIKG